jgi:hypothetical protein
MNHTWTVLVLALVCSSTPGRAADDPTQHEQFSNLSYFPKELMPVRKVAISGINVRLGVHLERLTLISGEGNTDKKVMAGLLAGAATLLGGRGGADWAEKEPLEEHLAAADAQAIADEIGLALVDAVTRSGLEVVPPADVTALPAYVALEGESNITTDTENVKGNLIKPSYFFGYQQVPVLGYKFRKKPAILFGVPSDSASTPVRLVTGVPLTLSWRIAIVNDRKVMRVRELTLESWGKGNGMLADGDDKPWGSISIEPDALNVASGESHKNREYWAALAPRFAETANAMALRLAAKFNGQ